MVRLAELEIDPVQLRAYLPMLREEIEASLAVEPGVLMLHAVQLREAPHKAGAAGMVRSLRLIDADPIVLGTTQLHLR